LLFQNYLETGTPSKFGFVSYEGKTAFDNFRVRKYTSPEPTYSIGAEEIAKPFYVYLTFSIQALQPTTVSDILSRTSFLERKQSILPSILSVLTKKSNLIKSLPQTFIITDALTRVVYSIRSVFEQIIITDILIVQKAPVIIQPIILAINLEKVVSITRIIPESIAIADIIKRQVYIARAIPQLVSNIISLITVRMPYLATQIVSIIDIVSSRFLAIREIQILPSIQAFVYRQVSIFREISQSIIPAIALIRNVIVNRFAQVYPIITISLTKIYSALRVIPQTTEVVMLTTRISSVGRIATQSIALTITAIRQTITQRFAQVFPSISVLVSRQIYVIRTLTQVPALISTVKTMSIPYLKLLIVQVSTVVSRQILVIKEILAKPIIETVLKVVSPAKVFYELLVPPYKLFEWATHIENLILILLGIGSVSAFGLYWLWVHKEEFITPAWEKWKERKRS
jgi:hypothetical protein